MNNEHIFKEVDRIHYQAEFFTNLSRSATCVERLRYLACASALLDCAKHLILVTTEDRNNIVKETCPIDPECEENNSLGCSKMRSCI